MTSEVVEINPVAFGLGSAAAAAMIFGYLITGGYYEIQGLNEGKISTASGGGFAESGTKKLQAPFQWLVTSSGKENKIVGNTQTITRTEKIDPPRMNALKYVGIGLVVIGWILLTAAVSVKLTDKDAWSTSKIAMMLGSMSLMAVMTVVNMMTINSVSKGTRFVSGAMYSLLWLGFGFYIGVCDSAGFDIEWDRAILGMSGGFLISVSQLFTSSDSQCCEVSKGSQELRGQNVFGATTITRPNVLSANKSATSAGVYSLGMPLYCMGLFMVVFAVSMK